MTIWPEKIERRHVFLGLGLFFLVTLGANIALITLGVRTHPGVQTEDAYTKGIDYNRTLEAADAQDAQGWALDLRTRVQPGSEVLDVRTRLTRNDTPVAGATVELELIRPVVQGLDRRLILEESAAGVYSGQVPLTQAGRWRLVIHVADDQGGQARFETDRVF